MTAQAAYETLLREHVAPPLKDAGFRRRRGNFHRPVGENWEVINFQASAYSDRDSLDFTINLGVAICRAREGRRAWKASERPTITQCPVSARIGLIIDNHDRWWTLTPETNLGALADATLGDLEHHGLHWLRRRSDDATHRDLLFEDIENLDIRTLRVLASITGQIGPPDCHTAAATRLAELEAEL